MKSLASTLCAVVLALSGAGVAFAAAPAADLIAAGADLGSRTVTADANLSARAAVEVIAAPATAIGNLTAPRTYGLLFIGLVAVGMAVHRRSHRRD